MSQVELELLTIRALTNELTEKGTRKMLKALSKKFLREGLLRGREKVVLCAYIKYGQESPARLAYMKKEWPHETKLMP